MKSFPTKVWIDQERPGAGPLGIWDDDGNQIVHGRWEQSAARPPDARLSELQTLAVTVVQWAVSSGVIADSQLRVVSLSQVRWGIKECWWVQVAINAPAQTYRFHTRAAAEKAFRERLADYPDHCLYDGAFSPSRAATAFVEREQAKAAAEAELARQRAEKEAEARLAKIARLRELSERDSANLSSSEYAERMRLKRELRA